MLCTGQNNVHSGDPKQQKNIENPAFKRKIGQEIRQQNLIFDVSDVFRRFLHVFEVLEARKLCKSFLEAIRIDSTVFEPVATLKTSNRLIFYVFRPPFCPAGSSIPALFVEK